MIMIRAGSRCRYVAFQLAEVAVPRALAEIMRWIDRLPRQEVGYGDEEPPAPARAP